MSLSNSHARIVTIPGSDAAFRKLVEGVARDGKMLQPEAFEARLRRVFPRVAVRQRALTGEPLAWYVYRDGQWRPSDNGPWWDAPGLPSLTVSMDGWITDGNATALSMLGLDVQDLGARHFTDFVVPGGLEDALALFTILAGGDDLVATIVLRPTTGDAIAVDVRATRTESGIVSVLRLAHDVTPEGGSVAVPAPEVICRPDTDPAFARYAQLALARMPEPTPDGLALRLRRLYPHAHVSVDAARWIASRDMESLAVAEANWWHDQALPRVRYDAEALILEANEAAQALLGSPLVGHHWQEFVTPGSSEQVAAMLAILAEVGAAESRFRIPSADGSLVEFDSYTTVNGDSLTTVMRPRA